MNKDYFPQTKRTRQNLKGPYIGGSNNFLNNYYESIEKLNRNDNKKEEK